MNCEICNKKTKRYVQIIDDKEYYDNHIFLFENNEYFRYCFDSYDNTDREILLCAKCGHYFDNLWINKNTKFEIYKPDHIPEEQFRKYAIGKLKNEKRKKV